MILYYQKKQVAIAFIRINWDEAFKKTGKYNGQPLICYQYYNWRRRIWKTPSHIDFMSTRQVKRLYSRISKAEFIIEAAL